MRTPRKTRRSADFRPPRPAASGSSPAATLAAPSGLGPRFASAWGGGMPSNAIVANAITAHALIDPGAILALLDRSDHWHDACVDAFRQLRLPLLTSAAVLR